MSVRIAVLGAGRIGQVHARAIAGHDAAVLAAIADPIVAAANVIADQYGCDVRTIDEIAASDDVDGVIICTPTDTHADLIEKFVHCGKAIFCEKPIDLGVDRVRACLEVVNKAGALLMGQREPTCLGAVLKPAIRQNYGRLNVRMIFYGFMAVFLKPDQI